MPNPEQDTLDAIDALVDEQLARYPQRSGYDRNVNQKKCGHCGRDFHGLAITTRLEQLRESRCPDTECVECVTALAEYDYATDESEVLCPGSRVIGPWIHPLEPVGQISARRGYTILPPEPPLQPRWWRCDDLAGLDVCWEDRRDVAFDGRLLSVTSSVTVNGETTLLLQDSNGEAARYGEVDDRPSFLEIFCVTSPTHGDWKVNNG